jgi:ADP-ribosylglycohydrolase
MIIAVARARITAGTQWLSWLQSIELPFFLSYERGAGASVKRACRSWSEGWEPWTNPRDRTKYFATGANGAAMRIAPHVVARHRDADFDAIATDVVKDAAATHGHPRALVGALVHAFALWSSLRATSPLAYGWVIHTVLDGMKQWGASAWQALPGSWQDGAKESLDSPYGEIWHTTRSEVERSLRNAQKHLSRGATSAPIEFLTGEGLCVPKTKGSGTLSAVGAIYLAARSAANPMQGIATSAQLSGADTDTLASMTGSLLAAGLGESWLGSYGREVQDAALLTSLAEELLDSNSIDRKVPGSEQARRDLKLFSSKLPSVCERDLIRLPDRRKAEVISARHEQNGRWQARRVRISTKDGQTLNFICGTHKVIGEPNGIAKDSSRTSGASLQGVYIPVSSLGGVHRLFQYLFGEDNVGYGESWVSYGNFLFRYDSRPMGGDETARARLRISVIDVAAMRNEIANIGFRDDIREGDGGFRVIIDPYLEVDISEA